MTGSQNVPSVNWRERLRRNPIVPADKRRAFLSWYCHDSAAFFRAHGLDDSAEAWERLALEIEQGATDAHIPAERETDGR